MKPTVLFLCTHNAGRSQMAAGFMRQVAGERVRVISGGSEPADTLNPAVVEAMAEMGIDIGAESPRRWDEDDLRQADTIVTMGCGDACPVMPGKKYVDWELPDPSGQPLSMVRTIRDQIRQRVEDLVRSLASDR